MLVVALWAVLTATLWVLGPRMWKSPTGGIPGYSLGTTPPPRRVRMMGIALTIAAVVATALIPFFVWAAWPVD